MGTDKKSALPRFAADMQGIISNAVFTLQLDLSFVKCFSEIFSSRARIFSSQLYELTSYEAKGGVL